MTPIISDRPPTRLGDIVPLAVSSPGIVSILYVKRTTVRQPIKGHVGNVLTLGM